MDLKVKIAEASSRKTRPTDESQLGFGKCFSDHMFLMNFDPVNGWTNARIEPYHALELDPATMVLHYGQEVFEGLKAYRGKGGGIYLFRHRDNIRRMSRSCERLVMPALPEDIVSNALKALVTLDADWIPTSPGCALYIRPTMIATDPALGVRPSETYLFYIIVGPVGAYYPEGFNPVKIWVAEEHVRAARGGTGEAKTGGNYAGSLFAQRLARSQGYSQVLWLDALEHRYVEEVGTMNIFFRIGDEVVTSPLTGTILPGITRDSAITLLRDWGVKVSERRFGIDEALAGIKSGKLTEVFGTGTAAIISPVKAIKFNGEEVGVGDGNTGPLSLKLYEHLLALQYGEVSDPFGWVERIA